MELYISFVKGAATSVGGIGIYCLVRKAAADLGRIYILLFKRGGHLDGIIFISLYERSGCSCGRDIHRDSVSERQLLMWVD